MGCCNPHPYEIQILSLWLLSLHHWNWTVSSVHCYTAVRVCLLTNVFCPKKHSMKKMNCRICPSRQKTCVGRAVKTYVLALIICLTLFENLYSFCYWQLLIKTLEIFLMTFGLILAGCQVPTKAALSLPFSTGQKRENTVKGSWVRKRIGRDHSPITIMGKTGSTW